MNIQTIKTQLNLWSLLSLGLVSAVGFMGYWGMQKIHTQTLILQGKQLPKLTALSNIQKKVVFFRVLEMRHFIEDGNEKLTQLEDEMAKTEKVVEQSLQSYSLLVGSDTERKAVDALGMDWKTLSTLHNSRFIPASRSDSKDKQVIARELDKVLSAITFNLVRIIELNNEQAIQEAEESKLIYANSLLILSVLVVLAFALSIAVNFLFNFRIGRRLTSATTTAKEIAGGNLNPVINIVGKDEISELLSAMQVMAQSLRVNRDQIEHQLVLVSNTANQLATSTAEILSSVIEQNSSAQEQASAISETIVTINEVSQTALQAAERARNVGKEMEKADETGKEGARVFADVIAKVTESKTQSESLAKSIMALAEKNQAIADIITVVTDIADQTNLLALNASIEASRAGEHGKGFAVVATEVKLLADQSKKATAQVTQILNDIQKKTNIAVIATEDGTKKMNMALEVANKAGHVINTLSGSVSEAAQLGVQIGVSSGQQAEGTSQILHAMKDIESATKQTLAASRQIQLTIQAMNQIGSNLKTLAHKELPGNPAGLRVVDASQRRAA